MSLSEFALIERYLQSLSTGAEGVALGIGDDCALLEIPAGQQLALSVDTLVEGVHFPATISPADLACRALNACVSDLAAMGAEPRWLTLALTLPEANEPWLAAFAAALGEGLKGFGMALVGGDTTRGALSLTLQVHGLVPAAQALRRDGARPGDGVYVTGTLGDAMAGLDQLQQRQAPNSALLGRFFRPCARVQAGLRLRGRASAAVDISDGLAADLGHVLGRSGVGATLWLDQLPLSEPMRDNYTAEQAQRFALGGGEDFELCFTLPPAGETELGDLGVSWTRIGTIDAEPGLRGRDAAGRIAVLPQHGYQHF
ncbi:thiamine-phosphate kinase [Motiliproteus sediminis]|uniref:thiamine-phosphate kinase n=1 Tax=Motiliproteus sediminis TaxID=1468178 RepID=UPI001AEFE778|nr:thiamine-phosphate kinase [Motiliproteus sediminis]